MLQALEKVTHKIAETRKELVYLEKILEDNGAQIKDVEIKRKNFLKDFSNKKIVDKPIINGGVKYDEKLQIKSKI